MIGKFPENYKQNNPNIINQIQNDLKSNKTFHYLFMGVCGSGKTYLARIISQQFENTKFISAREAYRTYLYTSSSFSNDKSDEIKKAVQCCRGHHELLILDDIGSEKPKTESSKAFIEDIIEDRYEWILKGFGGSTIITTNLTGKQISELYGDRVLDRLEEVFQIMKFKEFSFRRMKRKPIIEG